MYKSPLRYPGGKSRAVKHIVKYFPPGLETLVSPFLGGGSIELHFASQGVEVFGYDKFEPLVNFWQKAIASPVELATIVGCFYPIEKAQFYHLQKTYHDIADDMERAAIFYVLNRSSFSGTTLSGGMSPDHPRFTLSSIRRLADFKVRGLTVRCADFTESLEEHKHDFAYLDPPYLIAERLYGNKKDSNLDFDHIGLAEILRGRDGWLLSYNDCDEIRELYDGYPFIIPEWAYGMGGNKKSNEVLIIGDK